MSSDSSDTEDLELLREAQDTEFLKEHLYSGKQDSSSLEVKGRPASLRKTDDQNRQFNSVRVTPEFRKFVAKKLTKILDKKLTKEIDLGSVDLKLKKKRKNTGVRLFSNSEKLIKLEKHSFTNQNLSTNNSKFVLKEKFVVSEEDIKTLAVSGEDILSQKDTKNWSNRSKCEIFTYRKTVQGKLELIETEFK